MYDRKQGESHLSTVKDALSILKTFTMDEPEKMSDLSVSFALNKSTVSRTMVTYLQVKDLSIRIP